MQNITRSWQGIICQILVILQYIQAWGKRLQVSQIYLLYLERGSTAIPVNKTLYCICLWFKKMIILVTTHWYYCYQQHTFFCWNTLTNLLRFIIVNFWSDDWIGGYYGQVLHSEWQEKRYPWENINLETWEADGTITFKWILGEDGKWMELVQIASNAADFGICTIENFGLSAVLLPLMYLAIRKRFNFKY